uniref:Putative 50S ribosomal protein L7/L12 n=1 Tax=viral metagenome TaxID=1070528 RepID=A0A6M3LQS9_9ZZZZ
MTDLLKLKLINTKKQVGSYYEYDIAGHEEVPHIDTVLVKHLGDDIDMIILYRDEATSVNQCSAEFISFGLNKINAIKEVRQATSWGLKESKDFVECFPKTIKVGEGGVSKAGLKAMVDGINAAGGTAKLKIGTNCDTCELRFRCFTER